MPKSTPRKLARRCIRLATTKTWNAWAVDPRLTCKGYDEICGRKTKWSTARCKLMICVPFAAAGKRTRRCSGGRHGEAGWRDIKDTEVLRVTNKRTPTCVNYPIENVMPVCLSSRNHGEDDHVALEGFGVPNWTRSCCLCSDSGPRRMGCIRVRGDATQIRRTRTRCKRWLIRSLRFRVSYTGSGNWFRR